MNLLPIGRRALVLAVAILALAPSLAQAQDAGPGPAPEQPAPAQPAAQPAPARPTGPVTPPEPQARLLRDAATAYKLGDYAKAIASLRAAEKLGDLNIIQLQLARALIKVGRCDAASQALARVLIAPRVVDPPVASILKDAAELRDEMASQCPASIIVECQPPDLQLFIDGLGPLPCDGQPITLLPGQHTLRGDKGEVRIEKSFSLGLMEQAQIKLSSEIKPAPVPAPVAAAPPLEQPPAPPTLEPESPRSSRASDAQRDTGRRPGATTRRDRQQDLRRPAAPKKPFLLAIQTGVITSGEGDVERETFEEFNTGSGQESSGVAIELMAAYRFSRRYNFHLGGKLNLIPEYQLDLTDENLAPNGAMTEVNLFAMLSFPIEAIEVFAMAEVGVAFLDMNDPAVVANEGDEFDGGNAAASVGLRWFFMEDLAATASLRFEAYSLQNGGDIFADEISYTIQGSRTLLTLGLLYQL